MAPVASARQEFLIVCGSDPVQRQEFPSGYEALPIAAGALATESEVFPALRFPPEFLFVSIGPFRWFPPALGRVPLSVFDDLKACFCPLLPWPVLLYPDIKINNFKINREKVIFRLCSTNIICYICTRKTFS